MASHKSTVLGVILVASFILALQYMFLRQDVLRRDWENQELLKHQEELLSKDFNVLPQQESTIPETKNNQHTSPQTTTQQSEKPGKSKPSSTESKPQDRMKRKIVIGMPSVLRNNSTQYLEETLDSIIKHLGSSTSESPHKVVVMNAESDPDHYNILKTNIEKKYKKEMENGFIEMISLQTPLKTASSDYFAIQPESKTAQPENRVGVYIKERMKNVCTLKRNFGDSLPRVIWRSKQALHIAFLLDYCKDKGDLYFQLEDDTPVLREWPKEILQWTIQLEDKYPKLDWGFARWYYTDNVPDFEPFRDNRMGGNIGLLFHSKTLYPLVDFLYKNFDEMPIDWLISEYASVAKKPAFQHSPPLVVHAGKVSTKESVLQAEKHGADHFHLDGQDQGFKTWADCDKKKS